MPKGVNYYFIPVFLALYFAIAFTPILLQQKTEIFPFFSFKLYSKVPNEFVKYDLLRCENDQQTFLLHQNSKLNKLEGKSFASRLNKLGVEFLKTRVFDYSGCSDLLLSGETVYLVELSGCCVETVLNDQWEVKILKRVK